MSFLTCLEALFLYICVFLFVVIVMLFLLCEQQYHQLHSEIIIEGYSGQETYFGIQVPTVYRGNNAC